MVIIKVYFSVIRRMKKLLESWCDLMRRTLNKLLSLPNDMKNVKAFENRSSIIQTHSINTKDLKLSFLVDVMGSEVIHQNNITKCSIKTVIYGIMGNAKNHILTSNLEFIAVVILKVDPHHPFCTQFFNFVWFYTVVFYACFCLFPLGNVLQELHYWNWTCSRRVSRDHSKPWFNLSGITAK